MFLALLRDPAVTRIVVEYRDWFCRFGSEYVEAALAAQGRALVVVDSGEVDDDLACMPSGGSAAWRRNRQHGDSGYR